MITFDSISLRYGPKIIFDSVGDEILEGDRIGLVGRNGVGKSTLFRVLLEQESLDAGEVIVAKGTTLGHLPQDGITVRGRTLVDEAATAFPEIIELQAELESAHSELDTLAVDSPGYRQLINRIGDMEHELERLEAPKLRAKIEKVLSGLGFQGDDFDKDTGKFSGGWQMRIALGKLLLQQPSLLMLDEPTNHLDILSQRWLEQFLRRYPGALLIISHDRAFLDAVTNRTFHLGAGRMDSFSGNFSFAEKEKAVLEQVREQQFEKQQREIERQEAFINRFRAKASKASQVQSRIKALDKIERIELDTDERSMHFRFPNPPRNSPTAIELSGLSKSYGTLEVFRDLVLRIADGERVAIVGPNGAGKSTLVRILAGEEPYDHGDRQLGHNTELAYFAQHQTESLDLNMTALQVVEEAASASGSRMDPRSLLGAFLFRGDDVFKPVRVLSGGERNRLALARMLMRPSNTIILDEPTNHLDLDSKLILQEALVHFPGTLVLVSHDRHFLDPVVEKVLEVTPGKLRMLTGNVSDYIGMLDEEEARLTQSQPTSGSVVVAGPAISAKERRRVEAERRQRAAPLKKKVQQHEHKMQTLHKKIEVREQEMLDPDWFKQGSETTSLMKELDAWKRELSVVEEGWMEASDALEKLDL